MKDLKDALDFARASAAEAFDQVTSYGNIHNAVREYRKNVTDTMREYGAMFNEPMALETFDAEIKVQNAKYELLPFEVQYQKLNELQTHGANKSHSATFDNLADAQLWWDSIVYLRNVYMVNCPRPQ